MCVCVCVFVCVCVYCPFCMYVFSDTIWWLFWSVGYFAFFCPEIPRQEKVCVELSCTPEPSHLLCLTFLLLLLPPLMMMMMSCLPAFLPAFGWFGTMDFRIQILTANASFPSFLSSCHLFIVIFCSNNTRLVKLVLIKFDLTALHILKLIFFHQHHLYLFPSL